MKTHTFTSTKTKEQFTVCTPDDYKKISLPYFHEWVAALKSGKYNQCIGQLCKPILNKKLGYCCLGVLSKVQGSLQKNSDGNYSDNNKSLHYLSFKNACYNVLYNNGKLPEGVKVENDYGQAGTLSICNDSLSLSFKDIAKVIETVFKP